MVNDNKGPLTADQRVEKALALRKEGYNCAQCVMMAFDDLHGLSADMSARISAALGGGVAGQGEICGAASVMSMLAGYESFGAPADKPATYSRVRTLCGEFTGRNGSMVCRELKARKRPCPELIEDAIRILHKSLDN
ncbi:MAG: C_GCAxxG_C_C family protein [Muribaculaceae bacterium]|nr:C_GCAxxG_C_C family protein [Muribaculaceae bacterium]